MKHTISDPGLGTIVRMQLSHSKFAYLETPVPCIDYKVGDLQFAIYTATLCKTDTDPAVFDAWLVVGGDLTGFYNRDCYPTTKDAVMQHIGRLVLDSNFKFVKPSNARKRSKSDGA